MSKALKALEKGGLVHLERLASILRGLTPEELETLVANNRENDQVPMTNDQVRMVFPFCSLTARPGPSRGDQSIRLDWAHPPSLVIGNWSLVI